MLLSDMNYPRLELLPSRKIGVWGLMGVCSTRS